MIRKARARAKQIEFNVPPGRKRETPTNPLQTNVEKRIGKCLCQMEFRSVESLRRKSIELARREEVSVNIKAFMFSIKRLFLIVFVAKTIKDALVSQSEQSSVCRREMRPKKSSWNNKRFQINDEFSLHELD